MCLCVLSVLLMQAVSAFVIFLSLSTVSGFSAAPSLQHAAFNLT